MIFKTNKGINMLYQTILIDEPLKIAGRITYEEVEYTIFEGIETKDRWYFNDIQIKITMKEIQ